MADLGTTNIKKTKSSIYIVMNNNSQEILRRVTQNDPSLTELRLVGYNVGDGVYDGQFYSNNRDDYPTL